MVLDVLLQDLGPEALAQIKAAQELAKQMSQQAVAVGFRPSTSSMPQMEAPSAVVAAAQAAASQIAQKVAPSELHPACNPSRKAEIRLDALSSMHSMTWHGVRRHLSALQELSAFIRSQYKVNSWATQSGQREIQLPAAVFVGHYLDNMPD